ncbi:MAG: 5-dehydro-4-deoxy-D-glucuronate isomerase [Defluviitaleaceae bacterium]|nr:5-dehydro-4-deoxy-D-glucuronate isomerase [Defluviitaleaceae bacterium]
MKLGIRYSNHPEDVKKYTTEDLRRHFLIEEVFIADEANLTYSHIDRIIVGGIIPVKKTLTLTAGKEMGVDTFFERREGGIINIGGKGMITIDGKAYDMDFQDGLYIGMGIKDIEFTAKDAANPPKFYFNSAPAHHAYPTTLITLEAAKKVHLGSDETSNKRTINQYVHPDVVKSCQLVMGMTILATGSVWNTMPSHTHERRMEAYFYFDMDAETRVIHLMGEPSETRHIVMSNEEAVLSPSWSIHSGVGTGRYTFIWGMCGENITFTDMDHIAMGDLK